jgi:hypothetical protein
MSRWRFLLLVATLLVAAPLTALGCGGSESDGASIRAVDSSWVAGQQSLLASPGFLALAARAQEQAARRFAARQRELALIEAARLAAKQREKAARLRAYLEAKRRAEAAYRAALRRAAIERRRQLAKLRELRRKRAEALRRLNERLRVPVGEECSDPRLRRYYDCRPGKLPVKRK